MLPGLLAGLRRAFSAFRAALPATVTGWVLLASTRPRVGSHPDDDRLGSRADARRSQHRRVARLGPDGVPSLPHYEDDLAVSSIPFLEPVRVRWSPELGRLRERHHGHLSVAALLPDDDAARTRCGVEVWGSALLSAVGAWLLAGRFTRSPAARAFVVVAFAVNGRWALQTTSGHTWHLAYAWTPWTLYFFDRAAAPAGRRRDVVFCAVCIAMMVYTGGIYPLPRDDLRHRRVRGLPRCPHAVRAAARHRDLPAACSRSAWRRRSSSRSSKS